MAKNEVSSAHSDDAELERARAVVQRVLERQKRRPVAQALSSTTEQHEEGAGSLERQARAARGALRQDRVASAELEEVSEVEYRQVRLERVVLVGIYAHSQRDAQNSLNELDALARTAGSAVVGHMLQRRDMPDTATYLGSGKAKELARLVRSTGADTVIVDSELAPSQRRALEDVVQVKVVDRTALILDIFAQHAQSREGKAQVELAQLEYLLPRLRGWGESMSRQSGGRVAGGEGIGSRGPGETKIELDRRRIRSRMARLRRQIKNMRPARQTRRHHRRMGRIPSVAIAGYTNAGKSTLLNRLTGAEVMVEDALFATLDPTVRMAQTPDGREYTLVDTVGFVRNLPTQLVEAFRSTLEEVGEADVIVHVVDAAHPEPFAQIRAVNEVLETIDGAAHIPQVIALNKADLAPAADLAILRSRLPRAVAVSARTGAGIDELAELIAQTLPRPDVHVDVVVPYEHGDLVNSFHETGQIEQEEYLETGTRLVGRVNGSLAHRLQEVDVANGQ
ncbi:GTPase HflX [Gleimia hominis]|uniref:GTPase HflX n=1 Tax=Gleimia hominis TaxID=595468 RepID=UPI000C80D12D|nr:GTPase HflX [Gleimia hominis]WIK64946.1 GTPase HflX [Gleimia hominis]